METAAPLFLVRTTRVHDLMQQHRAFARLGYDGHRRHSGLTTMHRLGLRRSRRIWRQRLAVLTEAARGTLALGAVA